MKLHAEVDAQVDRLHRIAAGARRSDCIACADILWPPLPNLGERLQALVDDPGVMLESPWRIVVFQRIGDELRYYAGGSPSHQDRMYLEQDRVWAEGQEAGIFGSVTDALTFAEQYLVEVRDFVHVEVPRRLFYSRYSQSTSRVAKALRPYRDRAWVLRRWLEGRLLRLRQRVRLLTNC